MLSQAIDHRCWRFRGAAGDFESRIFDSPDVVPAGEGWTDSPAKLPGGDAYDPATIPETGAAEALKARLAEARTERDEAAKELAAARPAAKPRGRPKAAKAAGDEAL